MTNSGNSSSKFASSLRLDIISGYVLAFSRVAAWAGVSAYVYRELGAMEFGLLALLRGTIALLSYTSFGIGPAMVHAMAKVRTPVAAIARSAFTDAATAKGVAVLDYAGPQPQASLASAEQRVFVAGIELARILLVVGLLAAVAFAVWAPTLFNVTYLARDGVTYAAMALGIGVAIRVASEPSSAALQVRGRLSVDNYIVAGGEVAWLVLVFAGRLENIITISAAWILTSICVWFFRFIAARTIAPDLQSSGGTADRLIVRNLLRFGIPITVAQAADFLYAPTDYIIINWLLSSEGVAAYAPAVQIDAALLLAVAGVAAALFPRAARAHAAGDRVQLRRLYIGGTFASLGLLFVAATVTLLLSEPILTLWLATPPAETLSILPLVLIHTVIGGSSGVGRAVLLGMGRVKAFTSSVLIAGAANVVLSVALAGPAGLGLRGVVIATIVVVAARCAIWMPWYVLRATAHDRPGSSAEMSTTR